MLSHIPKNCLIRSVKVKINDWKEYKDVEVSSYKKDKI